MKFTASLKLLILYLLGVIALCMLASCGSLRKLKTNVKQSTKVDSSSFVTAKVDSSTTSIISKVDSSGLSVHVEVEDENDGSETDVQITVHRPKADDYFSPTTVGVKSNKKVKGVKVDQQEKKAAAETKTADVKKEDTRKTDVKKEEKKKEVVVNKKKTWFSWWWLLLLLVPAAWQLFKRYYPVPYGNIISFIKTKLSV